jgi:hypothetical protein
LRRVIRAFAVRTASDLVDISVCCGAFVTFRIVRIIICVGTIEARSIGCILIGPVIGLFLSIVDNPVLPSLFKGQRKTRRRHQRNHFLHVTKTP